MKKNLEICLLCPSPFSFSRKIISKSLWKAEDSFSASLWQTAGFSDLCWLRSKDSWCFSLGTAIAAASWAAHCGFHTAQNWADHTSKDLCVSAKLFSKCFFHTAFSFPMKKKYIGGGRGGEVLKNKAFFGFSENERGEQKLAVRSLANRFFSWKKQWSKKSGSLHSWVSHVGWVEL